MYRELSYYSLISYYITIDSGGIDYSIENSSYLMPREPDNFVINSLILYKSTLT